MEAQADTATRRKDAIIRIAGWLGVAASATLLALGVWHASSPRPEPPVRPRPAPVSVRIPSAFEKVAFPTPQQALLDATAVGVFQATVSGRPESGLYGSVRTGERGQATFHEGIDIAATSRHRTGRPLDAVRAAADGRVAYVNRIAGNSGYGRYVVLTHEDPLGLVFTLYAHLAAIDPGLKAGGVVQAGTALGVMGNSASYPIPLANGHLHFEVGLIHNSRFGDWFRAQKLKPDHGVYHGWNLLGVDPLDFFRRQSAAAPFTFRDFLASQPVAFEAVVATRRCPDFFARYPALWEGAPYRPGAIVVRCTANGVPLGGRNATGEEANRVGRVPVAIQGVDENALGRNGPRLIARANGTWGLTGNGARWRDVLTW